MAQNVSQVSHSDQRAPLHHERPVHLYTAAYIKAMEGVLDFQQQKSKDDLVDIKQEALEEGLTKLYQKLTSELGFEQLTNLLKDFSTSGYLNPEAKNFFANELTKLQNDWKSYLTGPEASDLQSYLDYLEENDMKNDPEIKKLMQELSKYQKVEYPDPMENPFLETFSNAPQALQNQILAAFQKYDPGLTMRTLSQFFAYAGQESFYQLPTFAQVVNTVIGDLFPHASTKYANEYQDFMNSMQIDGEKSADNAQSFFGDAGAKLNAIQASEETNGQIEQGFAEGFSDLAELKKIQAIGTDAG